MSWKNWVYFIRSTDTSHVKIGTTKHSPPARLRDLQTGNPSELVLLGAMAGGVGLEKQLHDRFDALRVRGEWFRGTPELLAFIDGATMLAEQPVDDGASGMADPIDVARWAAGYAAQDAVDRRVSAAIIATGMDIGPPVEHVKLSVRLLYEMESALAESERLGCERGPFGDGVLARFSEGCADNESLLRAAIDSHHYAIAEEVAAMDAADGNCSVVDEEEFAASEAWH